MCLSAVHRRLEPAVDADLDQTHQCRDVIGHARHELLQRGGRRCPVLPRDGGLGGELDDANPSSGACSAMSSRGARPLPGGRDAARAAGARSPAHRRALSPRSWISATVNSSCGSSPAVSTVRYSAAAARSPRATKARASRARELAVLGVRGAPPRRERLERRVLVARRASSAAASRLELLRRRGAHSRRAREIAARHVDIEQALSNLVVVRREHRRLAQRFDAPRRAGLSRASSAAISLRSRMAPGDVADLHARARGRHAAVEIGRVERSEPDPRLRDARACRPARAGGSMICPRYARASASRPEAAGDLGRLQERMLVIRAAA